MSEGANEPDRGTQPTGQMRLPGNEMGGRAEGSRTRSGLLERSGAAARAAAAASATADGSGAAAGGQPANAHGGKQLHRVVVALRAGRRVT